MNAVEIEEAISALAEQPFDHDAFPFAFFQAFGNKPTTIKRLRAGSSNKSDQSGVLQTNNVHLKVCAEGEVTKTLAQLKASPATTKAKAKFVLATDGTDLEAEDLATGETIACAYEDFPDHFGFFLPLAGISTVKQIRESAFDIMATEPGFGTLDPETLDTALETLISLTGEMRAVGQISHTEQVKNLITEGFDVEVTTSGSHIHARNNIA